MSNDTISADGTTEPFFLQLAKGEIYKHNHVHKYGYNGAITTTAETIWAQGGDYSWSSAASVISVTSDDAADTAAGTGARTVRLEGLDANYLEITEDVTLNGTTVVDTTAAFLRLHRMYVLTAGTGLVNAGPIYAADTGDVYTTPGIPDTATGIRSTIAAGEGQTLQAFYTIPAGKIGYMEQLMTSSIDIVNYMNMTLRALEFGQGWRTKHKFIAFQDAYMNNFPVPLVFPAKTDIELRGVANGGTLIVAGSFDLVLITD